MGTIVDVVGGRRFRGRVVVEGGRIAQVREGPAPESPYLLPGFVDAHVHVESSMLTPAEFARAALVHGTVATVSDPHEIANVLGLEGMRFMIEDGARVPFKFFFGAPSCVPATPFESSGATLGPEEVGQLLADPRIRYLSEVMNIPGVIHGDPGVLAKIAAARKQGKRVDGHAPGLRGEPLKQYVAAGITADHESLALDEALEKVALGMSIQIREGSAARVLDAFLSLAQEHTEMAMFCSDDLHPDDLLHGHVDAMVRRAVQGGVDLFRALRIACVNPVVHYGLPVGLLRPGDEADFILVEDLREFRVLETWVRGKRVAERARPPAAVGPSGAPNRFEGGPRRPSDFAVPDRAGAAMRVIEAVDGQVVTRQSTARPKVVQGMAVSDPERDLLKIAVVSRYTEAAPAVGFVRHFGLKAGAMASSVAHDAHNIVAVGASDEHLCRAVNMVIEHRGGIAVASGRQELVLPLPVAGIMSELPCERVAERYTALDAAAKALGCRLRAPFMLLSFMALLVIPSLKLGDKGLFDGDAFRFVPLYL